MNIEGAVDWVKDHKAAAAAGIAAVLLAGLWMWHRSKVSAEQYQQGDTNGESGYTTPGGGQYLIPTSGVDGGGTSGTLDGGDTGSVGDILAALNDLNVADQGIATELGTVADTLKSLKPTKPTDVHKGKGKGAHKPGGHKPGGHGHGGTTKTPHPTHGGHGHGGHTGHTAKPKHPVIHNPRKPAGPSKAQRKAATGHKSTTHPHKPAKPAVTTHAPKQPAKRATKAPAKAPARRKAA